MNVTIVTKSSSSESSRDDMETWMDLQKRRQESESTLLLLEQQGCHKRNCSDEDATASDEDDS